jgi:hypothetical protein
MLAIVNRLHCLYRRQLIVAAMDFLLCVLVQYPAENMGYISYSVSFPKKRTTSKLIYRAECTASHVDRRMWSSLATRTEIWVRLHQKNAMSSPAYLS